MPDPSNQDPVFAARRDPEDRYRTDPSHALPPAEHPTVTDPAHLLPAHATEPPARRTGRRLVVLAIIVLLAAAIVIWRVHANHKAAAAAAQKAAAAANAPIPVQVSLVQQKTVPVFLTALGTVTAYNTVTINTRVSGQLLEVNFREGQAVRKGQVLLEIDPRPYQAAVDQAVGQLARDQASLKDLQAEAERYTALYQAGVVSKEQQQLEVSNADQTVGSIKADQAAIEAAKVNLGYTRIVSPIDGVVGLRAVDPGNIVNSGQTTGLVTITQIHPIAIIFTLPEDQLPQVQQAMNGHTLVVDAYDRSDAHELATGSLLTIDNQIDTTTGTAKLKAVFDNKDGSLFPNQFVNVRLVLRQRPNAIVVPTAAIQTGNQGTFVFVVNPGSTPANKLPKTAEDSGGSTTAPASNSASAAPKAKNGKQPAAQYHADSVPVTVALTIGTNSVVDNGPLKAGQQVIVDGAEKLVDGGNVTPKLAPPNVAPAASSTIGATPDSSPPTPEAGVSGGLPTPSANGSTQSNGTAPSNGAPSSNGGTQQ